MQRLKVITLALIAAVAISAVASAAASAAKPEWRQKGAVITANVEFTGEQEAAGFLETANGTKVECTGGKSTGEIEKDKFAKKTKVTFTGCKQAGQECKTTGANAEEIRTNELSGELVYVDAAKTKVGLLLKQTAAGGDYADFVCVVLGGEVKIKVTGEVICETTPLNKEEPTGKLTCALNAGEGKGEQQWDEIEGKAEEKALESTNLFGAKEEAAVKNSTEIKWKGTSVEISA
jgi:hypothetical protein